MCLQFLHGGGYSVEFARNILHLREQFESRRRPGRPPGTTRCAPRVPDTPAPTRACCVPTAKTTSRTSTRSPRSCCTCTPAIASVRAKCTNASRDPSRVARACVFCVHLGRDVLGLDQPAVAHLTQRCHTFPGRSGRHTELCAPSPSISLTADSASLASRTCAHRLSQLIPHLRRLTVGEVALGAELPHEHDRASRACDRFQVGEVRAAERQVAHHPHVGGGGERVHALALALANRAERRQVDALDRRARRPRPDRRRRD